MEKDIYAKIAHPLRKDLIIYLGQHGPSRYTDIARKLNISVGSFYYHVRVLQGLVEKKNGTYRLTPKGREVYEMLLGTPKTAQRPIMVVFDTLTLKWLHEKFYAHPRLSAVFTAIALLTVTYLSIRFGKTLLLLSIYGGVGIINLVSPSVTLLITYLLSEATSVLLRGRAAGASALASISVAMLIVSIYMPVEAVASNQMALKIAYYGLQAESIFVLARGISVSKGIGFSHSLALSFMVAYIGAIIPI